MTNNSSDELSEYTNNANTTLEGLDDVIYDVHYVYTNERWPIGFNLPIFSVDIDLFVFAWKMYSF